MRAADAWIFLYMARQARLSALAAPSLAYHFKAIARFWLAMARRTPVRRIP